MQLTLRSVSLCSGEVVVSRTEVVVVAATVVTAIVVTASVVAASVVAASVVSLFFLCILVPSSFDLFFLLPDVAVVTDVVVVGLSVVIVIGTPAKP